METVSRWLDVKSIRSEDISEHFKREFWKLIILSVQDKFQQVQLSSKAASIYSTFKKLKCYGLG